MSTLEIADTFDPYYAGRQPFFCPRRSDSAVSFKAPERKGRNGSETTATEAGTRRPGTVPPRR